MVRTKSTKTGRFAQNYLVWTALFTKDLPLFELSICLQLNTLSSSSAPSRLSRSPRAIITSNYTYLAQKLDLSIFYSVFVVCFCQRYFGVPESIEYT